mgnify:CR=1 FL=1
MRTYKWNSAKAFKLQDPPIMENDKKYRIFSRINLPSIIKNKKTRHQWKIFRCTRRSDSSSVKRGETYTATKPKLSQCNLNDTISSARQTRESKLDSLSTRKARWLSRLFKDCDFGCLPPGARERNGSPSPGRRISKQCLWHECVTFPRICNESLEKGKSGASSRLCNVFQLEFRRRFPLLREKRSRGHKTLRHLDRFARLEKRQTKKRKQRIDNDGDANRSVINEMEKEGRGL